MPIACVDRSNTNEGTLVNIDILVNDSDIEVDRLPITAANASTAAAAVYSGVSLSYTPNVNFSGSDIINYTVSDGQGGSASSTVSVTISAVNDMPIAGVDSSNTNEDTLVNIDVLANDSDIDGDTLTITAATATSGSVTIDNGISLTYTPNVNFSGTDMINYTISDGQGGNASSTVTVTVDQINDAPVAGVVYSNADDDKLVDVDVLANDSDIDGDTFTITAATATS